VTNANQEFEALADAFYRETGLLAPGKSVPAAMAGDVEDRHARWEAWLKEREEPMTERPSKQYVLTLRIPLDNAQDDPDARAKAREIRNRAERLLGPAFHSKLQEIREGEPPRGVKL